MARSNSISYLLISTHPTLPQNIPNTQGQILTLILYQILQERNRSSCSTPLNLKRAVVKTTPKTTILTLKRLPLSPPRFLIFLEAVCSQCANWGYSLPSPHSQILLWIRTRKFGSNWSMLKRERSIRLQKISLPPRSLPISMLIELTTKNCSCFGVTSVL